MLHQMGFVLCLLVAVVAGKTWIVAVYTGDRTDAGTDANVFIRLYGDNGHSSATELDNDDDNFERDSVDYFTVYLSDVGRPTRLDVWHDNAHSASGWYLNKV